MVTCNSLISKYNLNKDNIKKWLLANHPDKTDHPDKNNSVTNDEYNTVIECYRENKINKTFKKEIKKEMQNTKKTVQKFLTVCVKQQILVKY